MKKKLKKILNQSFLRNVIVMASGTAAAQAVAMALSPIITRLYGPEAFGVMGTFNSLINIIVPVVALSYPIAIVLPKHDQDAIGIVRLSLFITGIMSALSFVIIIFFKEPIKDILNLNEISGFLYLIPLVVIFGGLVQVTEQWLIRTKQFSITARVVFMQSLITNGSKVGIGYFFPTATVLVILTALGNGIKALMMIVLSKKSPYRVQSTEKEKKNTLKTLAKKYYDFPLYRAPEVFLSGISFGFPVLMLTAFFGPASAGFYSIGMTVLGLPTRLISKSVGDVFYPRIAEANNNHENIAALLKKATIALAGIGFFPYVVIFLFGPSLFSFVFGSEWETADKYARWISFYSFFNFMNKPSVQTLPVINAQKFHLIYTVVRLVCRLSALAIGYYVYLSDIMAVTLYGITGAILDFGLIVITYKLSKRYQFKTLENKVF